MRPPEQETCTSDPGQNNEEELEQLRSERDHLQHRVDELEARPERRSRTRRVVAVIFVVLAVITFGTGVPSAWANRTLLDTDNYVELVGPLAEDPAIQEALAREVTKDVFEALDVQTRVSGLLGQVNSNLTFLSAPVTTAIQGFVQDRLQDFFASDAFDRYWTEANQFVHTQLLAALKGEGETVEVQNGQVVLNLVPLVNEGLKAISGIASDLIGRDVQLPQVSGDEVPSKAISEIEQALGVDLPDDFGHIVVYSSQELAEIQQAIHLFQTGIVVLTILWIAFTAGALWVSQRRRRTLLQLSVSFAVVLVIERRFAMATADQIVDTAKPENQAAASSIVDQVLGSLLTYTGWMLAIVLIVVVVALVTGPYRWAVAIRNWIAGVWDALVGAVGEGEREKAAEWVSQHRDLMMFAGAAVGLLILFLFDLSVGWFLLVSGLLIAYEIVIYRAAAKRAPQEPEAGGKDADVHA